MADLSQSEIVSLDTGPKDSACLSAIFEATEEAPQSSSLSHPQVESRAFVSTQIKTASLKTKPSAGSTATAKIKLTTVWMLCCKCPYEQIVFVPPKKCSNCKHVQVSLISLFISHFALGFQSFNTCLESRILSTNARVFLGFSGGSYLSKILTTINADNSTVREMQGMGGGTVELKSAWKLFEFPESTKRTSKCPSTFNHLSTSTNTLITFPI
jgi:hypothetical protein